MRILFISRAYPPVTGGIENQNYELSVWLPKNPKVAECRTIANTHGRKFLPIFLPYATIVALVLMRKYDVLLLGDGVLSIIGWIVKIFYKKPVVSVVHGLDINYDSASLGVWYEKLLIALYQKIWVDIFFKSIDKFIAVGNETVNVAIKRGIPPEKLVFIPNGIDINKFFKPANRKELENILKINVDGKIFILTSGRLAKRKGVAWFCEEVMPNLPENLIYIVAGEGPDRKNIENAIAKNKLFNKVRMLGKVTENVRDTLYNSCDIFVQPNIKVAGDMEGFGLSVIEAASCRIPVVASNLEGLKDAIKNGQNGLLVEPCDVAGYVKTINSLIDNEQYRHELGEKARQFVADNFYWEIIAVKYVDLLKRVINK